MTEAKTDLTFTYTGNTTKTVRADGEVVGSLIYQADKRWVFVERIDYLGINPRIAAEIRAGAAEHIKLLNIIKRLAS